MNYNSLAGIENKYLNDGMTDYLAEEYGQSRTVDVPNPIFSS